MGAEDNIVPAGAGVNSPIKPGSVRPRPTRADAEEKIDDFYRLLEDVRKNRNFKLLEMASVIGHESNNPEQNLLKSIRNRGFGDEERRAILKFIFEEGNLLSGKSRAQVGAVPDALYFAFLNWVEVKETSQDNARARILGTYKLWRFSVEHDSEIVCGRIVFTEDPDTRAVKARMIQPKKADPAGYRSTLETASGYLFRVSHMYLMLLADDLTKDVRMTILPRVKIDLVGDEVSPTTREQEIDENTGKFRKVNPRCVFEGSNVHIVHMDGFGLGIDGSSGFFSPVHLSLVDDVDDLAALDASLDVVPEDDSKLPARVVRKLKRNGPLRRL